MILVEFNCGFWYIIGESVVFGGVGSWLIILHLSIQNNNGYIIGFCCHLITQRETGRENIFGVKKQWATSIMLLYMWTGSNLYCKISWQVKLKTAMPRIFPATFEVIEEYLKNRIGFFVSKWGENKDGELNQNPILEARKNS